METRRTSAEILLSTFVPSGRHQSGSKHFRTLVLHGVWRRAVLHCGGSSTKLTVPQHRSWPISIRGYKVPGTLGTGGFWHMNLAASCSFKQVAPTAVNSTGPTERWYCWLTTPAPNHVHARHECNNPGNNRLVLAASRLEYRAC